MRFRIIKQRFVAAGFGWMAAGVLLAQTGTVVDADKAWREVETACRLPSPPPEWEKQRPATEDIVKFRNQKIEAANAAADKALGFYQHFPEHANAAEARKREYDLVYLLVRMGDAKKVVRLEGLEKERLADAKLTEAERFQILSQILERKTLAQRSAGMATMLTEYEKGIRDLQKQFPKRVEIYEMLLDVATQSEGEKAIQLARELATSDAAKEVKESAQALLRRLEAKGKPLPIAFAAVDGHQVDLSKMKGKVVLVDFWATWCPECVEAMPSVRAVYEKLHGKGFEIIGISFDEQREALLKFTVKQQMTWPQYFDGKGWDNKIGQDYGIERLPAMWLVDKRGNLREFEAGKDLEAKVTALLKEP